MKLGALLIRAANILVRGYDAAGASGRWPLAAQTTSPLAAALSARPTIAARAAYLANNSPYVAAAVGNLVTAFCGDGPSLQHDDRELVVAWNGWWAAADIEGVSTLGGIITRAARSWIVTGEAFVTMKPDPETGALRLQLVSSEQIDESKDGGRGAGYVVNGIEVDAAGKHVAVWIKPLPPDHPQAAQGGIDPIRVPIEDCVHLFEPATPGATRGLSILAPIMTRALEVDLTEDALVKQAQVAALLGTYITDPSGNITLDGRSGSTVSLEPGIVRFLPVDSMVTTVAPPDNANGVEFQRAMIRSIAAGLGIPFELVSADLSQTSFSSARFGDRYFRRRIAQVQRLLLEPMLDRIFYRFLALETLTGRLQLDLDNVAPPRWLWSGWEAIDPLKDVKADTEALRAGFVSRAEVIAKRSGRDVADVDREVAADPRPLPAAPSGDFSFSQEASDAR